MAQTNVQAFSGDVEVADSLTATNLIRGVVEEAVRWNSQNEGVFPQSASTRYYKIATLGTTSDASNGGKLRISGIIGGFSENETTLIDAFVASRGGIRYGGTLTGYGGDTSDVDIVVYLESGGTFSVWIKVIRFFTFDFTIMGGQVSNNARRLTVLSCPTTDTSVTTPTGTLQGSVVDSCSVVFTDDGNVGIGTDNPTSKLEVGDGSGSASGNAPGSITVNGTGATKSTGGKPGLYHRANVGLGLWSDVAMTMQVNGSSGTPLEAMRILNSGNVGIGTAIPKDVLHIFKASTNQTSGLFIEKANSSSGTAQITFGTANVNEGSTGKAKAGIFFERTATNGRGELHFCVDSSSDNNGVALSDVRMAITNAGNVGIGTDAPTGQLEVHGSGQSSSTTFNQAGNMGGCLVLRDDDNNVGSGGAVMFGAHTGFHAAIKSALEDGTNNTRGRLAFFVRAAHGDATMAHVMTLADGGNVGIGTTNPAAPLHVHGPGSTHGLITRIGGYDGVLDIGTLPTTYGAETIYMQTRIDGGSGYVGDRQVMALQPDAGGRVGIGTTQPHTPLHVHGAANKTHTNGRYFNSNEGVVTLSTRTRSVSIFATGDIMSTSGFLASSDRRIKKDIIDVNDSEALDTLRLLKPKTYKYKDSFERGEEPVWGFIAQDVSNVISNSIRLVEETIPNIYELADVSESNVITLNTFNTSDLEANTNTIQIIHVNGTTHDVTITSVIDEHTIRVAENLNNWSGSVDAYGNVITETTTTTLSVEEYEALESKDGYVPTISGYQSANVMISVEEYEALGDTTGYTEVVENYTRTMTTYPGNKLFVYGQRVTDFHSLNKNAIWTVATSALQEVDRQLQDTKAQLASVLTRLDALENA